MKNAILAMVVGMSCSWALLSAHAAVAAEAGSAPAAESSAPTSAETAAKAKAVREQVEAALAAADQSQGSAPAPAPGAAAAPSSAPGTAAPAAADTRSLDEETQTLKKDVVDLNRDLFVLEEELLFPANTQVAVYVSMDVGEFFALDSITLKIDNKEVTNYLYTPREVDALLKGGVQRLYLGNLKVGNHELVAVFSGKGPDNRDYRRGASLKFDKSIGAKYLELKIEDRQRKMQPEFEIKDWE
ncbi:MAG TPA: hypothetical protein VMF03_12050 [Steroidobacteraceae bacterium]|nr:hypothetical protein [Steroidobacteraceae bacterium]